MMHETHIQLAHGGGGALMQELLIRNIFPALANASLAELADSARVEVPGQAIAFTTDSFVVEPLFFPGGDIGKLAVCGTVNDLAARGARPGALALAMIIEEGFPIEQLRRIAASVADTAKQAYVQIVTGDTKVVEKGAAAGIYLTTSGIGHMHKTLDFTPSRIVPGDVLLVNGCLGDHGIAVMSQRQGLALTSPVVSDVAPLANLVLQVIEHCGHAVKCMTDLTRGGLAANSNEWARTLGFRFYEDRIPVRPAVRGACELLGLDVLTVANEGKMLFAVSPEQADTALAVMKAHPLGRDAAMIGEAVRQAGIVTLRTAIGGERIVAMPYGEELPRIC